MNKLTLLVILNVVILLCIKTYYQQLYEVKPPAYIYVYLYVYEPIKNLETVEVAVKETKPLTQEELIDTYIVEICKDYNVEPALVQSIVWHESRYDPTVSNGQCIGLMQVSKKWHGERANKLGVKDLYDPYGNILVGVDYIHELLTKYEDPALALMMYNMSHATAKRLYNNGIISEYAKAVLIRADKIKQEVR